MCNNNKTGINVLFSLSYAGYSKSETLLFNEVFTDMAKLIEKVLLLQKGL